MNPAALIGAIVCFSLLWQPDAFLVTPVDMVRSAEATAEYQTDKSPVAEGVIERYILDPRGEVEGLLLGGGVHLYVTSRAADQLIKTLAPGDHVQVYGRRTADEGLVQADVIKNLTRRTSFVVPLRVDLPMQKQEHHLSVIEMSATGTIRLLLYHPLKGIVQGMVLSDDTQIRLPLDAHEELRRSLHVGDSVTIKGNGTKNQFGRAIEVVAIGRDPASLAPLDASLRRLP
jgi:hypothetical protein